MLIHYKILILCLRPVVDPSFSVNENISFNIDKHISDEIEKVPVKTDGVDAQWLESTIRKYYGDESPIGRNDQANIQRHVIGRQRGSWDFWERFGAEKMAS